MPKNYSELPKIEYGTIPKVLLIGNGLNQCFSKGAWGDLLDRIADKALSDDDKKIIKERLPYPLQAVVITRDKIDDKLGDLSKELYKVDIAPKQADMIKHLLSKSFDAVLTTNYTYELEQSLNEDFKCGYQGRCAFRYNSVEDATVSEKQFGIFSYMKMEAEEKIHRIWHIHGEASKARSIVLGHYYYGKMINQIQKRIPGFLTGFKGCQSSESGFIPRSWIDYFMMGDVYILGFGLDLAEMDIWWLLNCKKRNDSYGKVYYFEANMDSPEKRAKRLLLEAYNVTIITEKVEDKKYEAFYEKMIKEMHKLMDGN